MKKLLVNILVLLFALTANAYPPVTSGLVLHLDGSSAVTVNSGGQLLVSTWNDQAISDGTNNAVQGSTSHMPELLTVSGFANNNPVLHFDGSDELVISDNSKLDPANTGSTIFVVGKVSDYNTRVWFRKGNTSSSVEGYSFWTDDHERAIFRINADDTYQAGLKRDQQPGREISAFKDITSFTCVIKAGDGKSIDCRVNGIQTDWESFIGYNYSGTIDSPSDLELGTNNFNGYLAEVIIYNKVLSDTDRQSVESYLASKYGLLTSEKDSLYDFWDASDKAAYLLNIDANESNKFQTGQPHDIIALDTVYVPGYGQNMTPGWPVAVGSANNVSLMYREDDMRRSTDGGITWSSAINMNSFISVPNTYSSSGSMQALGKFSNGQMMLIDWKGVMTSSDNGVTWSLINNAFTSVQLSPKINNGPKIIEHPYWGLAVFPVAIDDDFIIRYSQNNGSTWQEYRTSLPGGYKNAEACAVTYGNAIIALSRNHNYETHQSFNDGSDYGTYQYLQIWSTDGHTSFNAALTNMKATGLSYGSGLWGQDTVELILNPYNNRLEALVVNRLGGGPGQENDLSLQTLGLWSIDPDELLAGSTQWKFEGNILTRGQFVNYPNSLPLRVEGLHPACSVIDESRNMQHIYVYAGLKNIVYGVYRISRTLDTSKLVNFLETGQIDYCPHSEGKGSKYDINEDCIVDMQDLSFFSDNWMTSYGNN